MGFTKCVFCSKWAPHHRSIEGCSEALAAATTLFGGKENFPSHSVCEACRRRPPVRSFDGRLERQHAADELRPSILVGSLQESSSSRASRPVLSPRGVRQVVASAVTCLQHGAVKLGVEPDTFIQKVLGSSAAEQAFPKTAAVAQLHTAHTVIATNAASFVSSELSSHSSIRMPLVYSLSAGLTADVAAATLNIQPSFVKDSRKTENIQQYPHNVIMQKLAPSAQPPQRIHQAEREALEEALQLLCPVQSGRKKRKQYTTDEELKEDMDDEMDSVMKHVLDVVQEDGISNITDSRLRTNLQTFRSNERLIACKLAWRATDGPLQRALRSFSFPAAKKKDLAASTIAASLSFVGSYGSLAPRSLRVILRLRDELGVSKARGCWTKFGCLVRCLLIVHCPA